MGFKYAILFNIYIYRRSADILGALRILIKPIIEIIAFSYCRNTRLIPLYRGTYSIYFDRKKGNASTYLFSQLFHYIVYLFLIYMHCARIIAFFSTPMR